MIIVYRAAISRGNEGTRDQQRKQEHVQRNRVKSSPEKAFTR